MPDSDDQHLQSWVGRTQTRQEIIGAERSNALRAALDLSGPDLHDGDALPPLWHWLYFWDIAPRSGLGRDGHAELGDFLPPVGAARRMWAGSRVTFPGALTFGALAERRSTVLSVAPKSGRTGRLVFVTVRHELSGPDGLAIIDEHDIVYREDSGKGASARAGEPAPTDAAFTEPVEPDPTLLFRYSALTFNGHRIHYDRDYARDVEGYDGLVVHGPLLATLMVGLADRSWPDRDVAGFEFRGHQPIFDIEGFTVCARPDGNDTLDVWVANGAGQLSMKGRTTFR